MELPDDVLRDLAVGSAGGVVRRRDGCRVPLPWRDGPPSFGFSSGKPWLPMPASLAGATIEEQDRGPASVELPPGEVIAMSGPDAGRRLPPATTAWVRRTV